jgi:Na+/H+ antiporter NhaD/arsenite permease-like protein
MMALTEFVVVTAPFCWATTVLQSDSSTLRDLLDNLPTITTAFQTIKEAAQHFPEAQRECTLYMVSRSAALQLGKLNS